MLISISYEELKGVRKAIDIIRQRNMKRFKSENALEMLERIISKSTSDPLECDRSDLYG